MGVVSDSCGTNSTIVLSLFFWKKRRRTFLVSLLYLHSPKSLRKM